MKTTTTFFLFAFSCACVFAQMRDIATLVDFANERRMDTHYVSWRWRAETKTNAPAFTSMALEPAPDDGRTVWRLTVNEAFPWGGQPERLRIIAMAHFPPEADAIVMRCKVTDGAFVFCAGGPAAVFGDSDVVTAPQEVRAHGDWQEVVFDLNRGLVRNYRRAGFGKRAESVSYTRWAQEPPALYMLRSRGTVLIRDVRLVARGEGRAFPEFAPDEIESVKKVPVDARDAFNFFVTDGKKHVDDFYASWRTNGTPRLAPPKLETTKTPGGGNALAATTHWVEEIRWAGVKVEDEVEGANAIRLRVRVNTPLQSAVAGRSDVDNPVDIGLLAAPRCEAFPFAKLAPKPEDTDVGALGYDYMYSHTELEKAEWGSALYSARRFVKNGEWATLTIPFADFACVGATGEFVDALRFRRTPESVTVRAVVALLPYPRRGRTVDSTLEFGDVEFVRVPAEKAYASYFRTGFGRLVPVPGLSGYGGYVQSVEDAPFSKNP